jgi:uncharacterized protein GlcG (DUF336 family)
MTVTRETLTLTHSGAMAALAAAIAQAGATKVPQCIFLVDVSGEVIASVRMDGAKYLSMHTARATSPVDCRRGCTERKTCAGLLLAGCGKIRPAH